MIETPVKKKLLTALKRNWQVYLLALPALVVLIWFRYVPMFGLQIAFKEYNLMDGFWKSEWANPWYKYFKELFSTPNFLKVLRNTLIINFYSLVIQFPLPIIFALMMNECTNMRYKKVVQTVSYLPHFLSWVIIYNIFTNLFAYNSGILNRIIMLFGGEQKVFLSDPSLFRGILVVANSWKSTGWGTIVILAAITSVNPDLYEAALIDGAGKLRRIWHVTLSCIRPTIVVLMIMRTGAALSNDVEMFLQFYNPFVYEVGDVLGTYMYRRGLVNMDFSFTTAAGLFTSVINFILLFLTDRAAKKMGEGGLW
ncbi:protein LplB [Spirochaetia bacterium]|nr:protein LplB [Spirochaetia bacterium]